MSLPFSVLTSTLEELEPVTGRTIMIGMLADMLRRADESDVAQLVYLAQGRLLPDFIQKEFGMSEMLIFRAVAQAFGSQSNEVLARFKSLGDAGLVAQEFAQKSGRDGAASSEDGLPLRTVYDHLMKITQAVGSGSQETKVSLLASLFSQLSPLDVKHVARIVVGRLRVGIGDPTLMDALSFARTGDKSLRAPIERAYNLTTDLGLVARTLYASGVEGLDEIQVKVGNPVRMALA